MTSAQNGTKTAISLWHSSFNLPRKIPRWIHCVAFTYVATTYNSYKYVACVASVSVRFRSKERGARVTRPCEKCWSRRARRGWGRVRPSPPPPPPSFIFWLSFYFSRGRSRKSRSSVFLCSETKRKRFLRRLTNTLLCHLILTSF